jgi:hypothetical protein
MGKKEQASIVSFMSFEAFSHITYRLNDQKMLFNLVNGEVSTPEGFIVLPSIPIEYYASPSKYATLDHRTFIQNLQAVNSDVFMYHASRQDGIEQYVTATSSSRGLIFYFCKDNESVPQVFLRVKGREACTFQKIDVSCFTNKEICSLLADDPDNSIWVSENQHIIVLNKDMQVCFRGHHKHFSDCQISQADKQYGAIEHQLILKQDYHKDPTLSQLVQHIQHFAGSNFRVFRTQPSKKLKLDMPQYQITLREDSKGNLIFSGDPSLQLAKDKRINLPHSLTLLDTQSR